MAHGDHVGDLIDDYVFARGTGNAHDDSRYLRRRVAAVAFVPGLLLVVALGHWTDNPVLVVGALLVLVAATAAGVFLPARNS